MKNWWLFTFKAFCRWSSIPSKFFDQLNFPKHALPERIRTYNTDFCWLSTANLVLSFQPDYMSVTFYFANNQDFKLIFWHQKFLTNQKPEIENSMSVMFSQVGWPLQGQFSSGHLVCNANELTGFFMSGTLVKFAKSLCSEIVESLLSQSQYN